MRFSQRDPHLLLGQEFEPCVKKCHFDVISKVCVYKIDPCTKLTHYRGSIIHIVFGKFPEFLPVQPASLRNTPTYAGKAFRLLALQCSEEIKGIQGSDAVNTAVFSHHVSTKKCSSCPTSELYSENLLYH